jgi:predicted nucleic acid-binding Zn ribbon protein
MSVFEAKCEQGHEFEYEGSYKDAVPLCAQCGSTAGRQIGNSGGFRLKGIGWGISSYDRTQRHFDKKKSNHMFAGRRKR